MKKIFNVFAWILSLTLIIYSFIKNPTSESIFGFEVNIWIYRLFWGIIGAYSVFETFKIIKSKKSKRY